MAEDIIWGPGTIQRALSSLLSVNHDESNGIRGVGIRGVINIYIFLRHFRLGGLLLFSVFFPLTLHSIQTLPLTLH